MRTILLAFAVLIPLDPAHADCNPPGLFRIVTANISPGIPKDSFAGKPKVTYRAGNGLVRSEETADTAGGIHQLSVINWPDVWVVNLLDKTGEHIAVFHLEESALRPLVDVGRVFSMAGRAVLGQSTIARFATAKSLLPEQQTLFTEAADTLRVVLWQQGRIGISQGTSAMDLPPALLSRHDRHLLKSGFRSILRLLQFTANPSWIKGL